MPRSAPRPNLKDYTPLFDAVVDDVGHMPAQLYGMIWRVCQQPPQLCSLSVRELSRRTRLNPTTVMRRLKDLVRAGYLEDLTPGETNRRHLYRLTPKGQLFSGTLRNAEGQ